MQSWDENGTPGPDLAYQDVEMDSQAMEGESNFIATLRRTKAGLNP